ncbi:MAG: hypothetical protein PHV93_04155 [Candidatus Pacebacteria bacterium]|nr:hypothetical protein [Candidatus Paceibacterota bacterium]
MFPLVVTIIIILACQKYIFDTWKWFALILIPTLSWFVISTPTLCQSIICFDRDMTAWYASISFLIVSLIVVMTKTLLLRRKKI